MKILIFGDSNALSKALPNNFTVVNSIHDCVLKPLNSDLMIYYHREFISICKNDKFEAYIETHDGLRPEDAFELLEKSLNKHDIKDLFVVLIIGSNGYNKSKNINLDINSIKKLEEIIQNHGFNYSIILPFERETYDRIHYSDNEYNKIKTYIYNKLLEIGLVK